MHRDFKKILADFLKIFKDEGYKKFDNFIQSYRFNVTRSYSSQITRECLNGTCEAFQWVEPFIKYLREDDTGKYYKVRALTATTSMNNNDYSREERIEKSARTLTYRPLNINHDYSRWLPFPDNRVDWAEYEDNAVECIIRISNEQRIIQNKIENGEIVNPSIEARPIGGNYVGDRYVPEAWNFTGMALLEKDKTIPGVPSTYGIEPLFLNEGMAERLVESLSVENNGEEGELKETDKPIRKAGDVISLPDRDPTQDNTYLEEHFSIQGLSTCGQCKFFEALTNTTTKTPSATGDGVKTDAFVTTSKGNFGLGVGVCKVASEILKREIFVKYTDWGCSDGRPRDTPNIDNRTTRTNFHEEIEVKAMEALYNKKLEEKEGKILEKDHQIMVEKHEKAELRAEISQLQEKLSKHEQEKNSLDQRLTSLISDKQELREEADKLKDDLSDKVVKIRGLDEDKTYYMQQTERLREQVNEEKLNVGKYKTEAERFLVEKNDAVIKASTSQQQAANDRDAKIRILEENSLLNERLADTQRKISDITDQHAKTAKENLQNVLENQKLREELRTLKDELSSSHRLINDMKKKIDKKYVVKL